MDDADLDAAADLLREHWSTGRPMLELPTRLRLTRWVDAYAIQARVAAKAGAAPVGWMLAGVSVASRTYVDVNRPFLGRILSGRCHENGATLPFDHNHLLFAEAEFCFRTGRTLEPRAAPYTEAEVLAAVDTLHLAIEIPNTRFLDPLSVGAYQLVADDAFGDHFVIGPAVTEDWRNMDLATARMKAIVVRKLVREGIGSRAWGDPRTALTFAVNEISRLGLTLEVGQFVATGGLTYPLPLGRDDEVDMDFGSLGRVGCRIA